MSDDDQIKPWSKAKHKLTVKEKLFVKEKVANPGQDPTTTLVKAGYSPSNPKSAKVMESVILAKPKVNLAIRAEIESMYPDALAGNVAFLIAMRDDPTQRPADRLAAVKELNQMAGYKSPTQHQTMHASVKLPKLPGDS